LVVKILYTGSTDDKNGDEICKLKIYKHKLCNKCIVVVSIALKILAPTFFLLMDITSKRCSQLIFGDTLYVISSPDWKGIQQSLQSTSW